MGISALIKWNSPLLQTSQVWPYMHLISIIIILESARIMCFFWSRWCASGAVDFLARKSHSVASAQCFFVQGSCKRLDHILACCSVVAVAFFAQPKSHTASSAGSAFGHSIFCSMNNVIFITCFFLDNTPNFSLFA